MARTVSGRELKGKRVLILVEDKYEDMEVWYPMLRLREAGAEVVVAGTESTKYSGKHDYPIVADSTIDKYFPKDFDCIVVPGGWAPDRLRRYENVLKFVREMHNSGKVVASICHGPWVLASAGILKGKKATCVPAIKDDVINAGAKYEDRDVVVDGKLVTSRRVDDLPAFCREIIKVLGDAGFSTK